MASVMPRLSPTMVSMVPMASHMPTAMESQLSTTANARLRLRPSPTMVSMEPMEAMVSQLSPLTDTHLSTTMASVMLMLWPRPSPTMVSMELMEAMVSQPSPPTDIHLSTVDTVAGPNGYSYPYLY